MQKSKNTYSLTIKNQIPELEKIVAVIDELSPPWKLSARMINHLNLVLEEIVSNIIFYAYTDDKEHEIFIDFSKEEHSIIIQITDNGKHFDFIKYHSELDIDSNIEDRKIGGLGIHILKKLVDEIEYHRKGEFNVVKLIKSI